MKPTECEHCGHKGKVTNGVCLHHKGPSIQLPQFDGVWV